jgi:uncharacterized protein (TIGR02265 family)
MTANQRVVFGNSMEGLWRALEPHTREEAEAFRKAGVNGRSFLPAYPVEDYLRVMESCAASRFGGQPPLEQYTSVGRLFFSGYEKTLVGQALMAMLKVLGPRRTLERMTRNFRTANNYSEAEVEAVGPNHHRVRLKHVKHPGFYRGLILSGVERAGARSASVEVSAQDGDVVTYEVRWS